MHSKRIAAAAIALTMSLLFSGVQTVFAEGENKTPTVNGEIVKKDNIPSVITNVNGDPNVNLEAVVAAAGLDELGEVRNLPDPILGEVSMAHYGFWNNANQEVSGSETNVRTHAFSKNGFQKLYMNHTGIARYYFRTYNTKTGWTPWYNSAEVPANSDPDNKVQAVQIRVKGYTGVMKDLYYKAVLSDGTVLDWAKNGQTMGTIGTGSYIVALKAVLWDKDLAFPGKTDVLMEAPSYEGTYLDASGRVAYASAAPYTGWGFYDNKQYYFKDGQLLTGWQYIDGYKYYLAEDGSVVKDLEPIMGLQGKYELKYNKSTKTMYVMAADGANGYIIPFKTFMTTNGPDTPIGTFKTYAKYRWKFMHDDIYCQFLSRFKDGFLMHSIIYFGKASSNNLDSSTYNHMEDAISGGCIRFLSGDAAWIYSNCPMGTKITIFEDPLNKGPVEKDAIMKPIPREQTWDPTDPLMADKVREQERQAAEAAAAAQAQAPPAANTDQTKPPSETQAPPQQSTGETTAPATEGQTQAPSQASEGQTQAPSQASEGEAPTGAAPSESSGEAQTQAPQ